MHQITLNGRECLVIEVPEGYGFTDVELFYLPADIEREKPLLAGIANGTSYTFRGLPTGTWQILLRSWDMTEGECKGVMPCYGIGSWHNYNAPAQYHEYLCPSALQSAQSLFTHLGYTHCVVLEKLS